MGFFSGNDSEVRYLMEVVRTLTERVQTLESNARYIADQPIQSYYQQSLMHLQNAFNTQPVFNEVPINDVVKAIVKHLGMEIEKVAEHTTTKPMEVKVTEKKPSVTMTGTDGVTGTTWSSHCSVQPIPTPKPKRKYTKRKPK